MAEKVLAALADLGQSIWVDSISREMLRSGELERLVQRDGVRGLTSNPTIFARAVDRSEDYMVDITAQALAGGTSQQIYDDLTAADVAAAADVLQPVWLASGGADGYASLEVRPDLSGDVAGTVAEVHRLRRLVNRPNLMIKVPGTAAGAEALRWLVAAGISVNVTLLFSVEQYEAIARAYLAGLEELDRRGGDLSRVASVASVFVSRIDSQVDQRLDALVAKGSNRSGLQALRGTAAVANARLCYARFQEIFSSPAFAALERQGARPQRLLWASTSTKDPAYDDLKYVTPLIGPQTVNTLPTGTLAALLDHGRAAAALPADAAEAGSQLAALAAAGIDVERVCAGLQAEGIAAFAADYQGLLTLIDTRRRAVLLQRGSNSALADLAPATAAQLQTWEEAGFARRLWDRDPGLWKDDPAAQAKIANRLGWLPLAESMAVHLEELGAFAREVRAAGFTDVVLLGMGGSSLCSEVLSTVLDTAPGYPRFAMLDSVDPGAVRAVERAVDLPRTLFLVASKSGTTVEPLSLFRYYRQRLVDAGVAAPGGHFVAITDPGTPLVRLAEAEGFRRVFINPPDIGGRYAALSLFGLIPAALMGADPTGLLAWARGMTHLCSPALPAAENPGLALGAALGQAALAGRDKLTFIVDPALAALGLWLEQLIAESTGKEGKGLVPVVGAPVGDPSHYGHDRCFVHLTLRGQGHHADRVAALAAAGHPVLQIDLPEPAAVGAEFLRWEIATAAAGAVLGIDPFDEPNVQEAKDGAKAVLAELKATGHLPVPAPRCVQGGVTLHYGEATASLLVPPPENLVDALSIFWHTLQHGDYVAFLAYTPLESGTERRLNGLRERLRLLQEAATCFGYGPRYLHSTGQLHKGGPDNGLFVMLTVGHGKDDLPIPGADYSFGQLELAQALGDMAALEAHGRRAMRLHLNGGDAATVESACRLIEQSLGTLELE